MLFEHYKRFSSNILSIYKPLLLRTFLQEYPSILKACLKGWNLYSLKLQPATLFDFNEAASYRWSSPKDYRFILVTTRGRLLYSKG